MQSKLWCFAFHRFSQFAKSLQVWLWPFLTSLQDAHSQQRTLQMKHMVPSRRFIVSHILFRDNTNRSPTIYQPPINFFLKGWVQNRRQRIAYQAVTVMHLSKILITGTSSRIMWQEICNAIPCTHSTTAHLITGAPSYAMWQEVCNAIHCTHHTAATRSNPNHVMCQEVCNAIHCTHSVRSMQTHANITAWHLRQQIFLLQRSFTVLHTHWSPMPCLIKGAIHQQPHTMQVFPMRFTPKTHPWISPVFPSATTVQ